MVSNYKAQGNPISTREWKKKIYRGFIEKNLSQYIIVLIHIIGWFPFCAHFTKSKI